MYYHNENLIPNMSAINIAAKPKQYRDPKNKKGSKHTTIIPINLLRDNTFFHKK